jgi:hypothetical protein
MRSFVLGLSLALASLALAKQTPIGECVDHSGAEATRCLEDYLAGGSADPAFTDAAVRDHCTEDVTYAMGGLGVDDLVLVLRNACADFGHDWLTVTTPPAAAAPNQAACRTALASELTTLRQRTIELLGSDCSVPEAQGRRCRRPSREGRAQKLARAAERHIAKAPDSGIERPGPWPRSFFTRKLFAGSPGFTRTSPAASGRSAGRLTRLL